MTDGETGEPVAGAFVSLRSVPGDQRAAGALSTARGHYSLDASEPGRYRLRVERIGYETWTSEAFELSAGETVSRELEIGVRAVELADLQVAVTGGCQADPEEASAAGRLWTEIRKALDQTAWAQQEGRYRFTTVGYQRTLAPGSGRVLESRTSPPTEQEGQPFRSLPVERLVEAGFRQEVNDTTTYFAPDARVLVSDAFAADHCFELADPEEAPAAGLVGLSFRPIEYWGSVDVRGTFWMSPDPVRLRELRFHYTGLSSDLPQGELGGRITYRRLPDGGWVVDDWRIRMPRTKREHMGTGILSRWYRGDRTRTRLVAIVEQGGRILRAEGPAGEPQYAEGTATVQGTVTDSLGGTGSPEGLRVQVAGTELWTRADSTGSFVLSGVPAGTRRIEVSAPDLELAGLEPPAAELVVREHGSYFVNLATPSPRSVVRQACGPEADGSVVLVGRVMDAGGAPVPGARVRATWTRQSIMVRAEGQAAVSRTPTRRDVTTDEEGVYRICGLPGEIGVSLRVEAGGGPEAASRREASLELPPRGLLRRDLVASEG